jgi:hypothetical protein
MGLLKGLGWFLAQVVVETLRLIWGMLAAAAWLGKGVLQAAGLLLFLVTFPILVPIGALAHIDRLIHPRP